VVSARAAVRRDLDDGLAIRAAAYSGFRPATLNELHRPFRVGNDLTEANAALEPETLAGVEAGLSWDRDRSTFAATVFRNRIEEAIVNVTVGVGPGVFPRAGFVPAGGVLRQRMNAGTIEARGIEVDARFELSDRISLRAALGGTDARLDGGLSAPQLTGLRPAQAPIWSATAGLDWQVGDRLALAADLRWEGRRFDDDLNSRVLQATAVVDLRADWSVSTSTVLWVAIGNLFDAEVEVSETATGVAGFGPPRSLAIGLRFARGGEGRP
jgi:outer membrane receptor protein involved in Fe transport